MDVYDAPMTDVIAALQITTPKTMRPMSPSAASKADAVGFDMSMFAPAVTTPRIARNSTIRITAVSRMPAVEARVMLRSCSTPCTPLSTSRWAPA